METMYLGYVKKERRRANETSYYPRRKEKMLRTIISVIITWSNIPVILTRPIDWDVKEGMEEEEEEEEECSRRNEITGIESVEDFLKGEGKNCCEIV